jgi:NAD(P)-dependent dehydrogenase (short-subunit alcohol dehydrogenase family)
MTKVSPASLDSFPPGGAAVVIGAGGAIGGAFCRALVASGRFSTIHGFSRGGREIGAGIRPGRLDLEDEAEIADAARAVAAGPAPRLVILAAGLLHAGSAQPEKSLRALDPQAMLRLYAVNTVGPALAAKHFTPLLPRQGKSVLAALSARVGSIGDNRLGGWLSYRASKAALNMVIRTVAIELARSHPQASCLSLHPGTVDSNLSRPFQRGVAPEKLFTPDYSAERLLRVIDSRSCLDTGKAFDWENSPIDW